MLNGSCKLFKSSDAYQHYAKVLCRILETNESTFEGMGVDNDDMGSHSAIKERATRCSTSCTVSSPMSSIFLCAGWSIGPVREHYIHYKKAGDLFVGRTICGLNCMATEFGISPCHFDFTGIHEEDRQST